MNREPGPATAGAAAQVFVHDLASPVLGSEDQHHLARVLRLRSGQPVVAADGKGGWRRCRFVAGAEPALEPAGPPEWVAAAQPAVTVAFVPVKGERPEWVVQKLTEIGVDRIVVLHSTRSVVRWDRHTGDSERALQRLRRVATAAAAQSRRSWLPVVEGIVEVSALATAVHPVPVALAELGGLPVSLDCPAVAVGPEGGWSDVERHQATAGALVDLGPTVLRAETAAVVAGTLLCALRSGVVGSAGAGPL